MIEILKWSDCFESADTRKRQRLGWFLAPSGCDSRGFRQLMRMGKDGLVALGFFQSLCQSMATMPIKTRQSGIFQNSDGKLMELDDILELSRLGGIKVADYRQITGRLVSVGWIRLHNSLESQQSASDMPPVCQSSPGFVQGEGEGEGQEEGKEPPAPEGEFPLVQEILPPNSSRLTKTEQGRVKVNRNTPEMIRIGKWFGQKESTLWTVAEYIALQQVDPSPEDMEMIGEHYSYEIPENGYRMTTISTLLNNWSKARAKAVRYFEENPELRSA